MARSLFFLNWESRKHRSAAAAARTVKRPRGQLTEKINEIGKHNLFVLFIVMQRS
jgi:hypothetical protein